MSGDIGRLTEELTQTGDVASRREAASRLRDLGFARRVSLEKRGTLARAAQSALAAHELGALRAALEDDDRSVRLDAIMIVGDFGDATFVAALQRHSEGRHDPEVRLAAIDSLGDIGGADSVSTLTDIANASDEEAQIRLAALTELEELAAKRITSGPDRRFDPVGDSVASTGEAVEQDETKRATERLRQVLRSIESETDADDLLRLKAADVRAYLESGV